VNPTFTAFRSAGCGTVPAQAGLAYPEEVRRSEAGSRVARSEVLSSGVVIGVAFRAIEDFESTLHHQVIVSDNAGGIRLYA
jgi:hypothetical protein